MSKTIGIILAGGVGTRFQGDKPKQYYLLKDKEIIWYSIDAFSKAKSIDDFIVVVDENEFKKENVKNKYGVKCICGGATRNHSLKNALDYIYQNFSDCEKIIENNAACPMINPKVIDDIIRYLDEYDYVQCAYKLTDALGSYNSKHVNRDDYFLIQSPDAYRFKMLYECFEPNYPNGHPAVQLPDNATGYNYFDFRPNIKVTYPEDLRIIEYIMDSKRLDYEK